MHVTYQARPAKVPSAMASLAIMAAVVYALVTGLGHGVVTQGRDALVSVFQSVPKAPEREPDMPPPQSVAASAPKGAPAPPNLKNEPTPVVAPPPRIVIAPPPLIVAATEAGIGAARASGASDRAGPGQGAGGVGDGRGGGGIGGDGAGGDAVVGPRHLRGKLSFSDLPDNAIRPGEEAVVGVRYTVGIDGRVSGCRITEPSHIPAVDAMACRLIVKRFRFRPARDESGRPTPADVVETHGWSIPPEPPEPERRRRG